MTSLQSTWLELFSHPAKWAAGLSGPTVQSLTIHWQRPSCCFACALSCCQRRQADAWSYQACHVLFAGASDAGAASPDSSSNQGTPPPRKGEPALKKYMQQFDQQRLLEMTKIVVSYRLGQWLTLSGEVAPCLVHRAAQWTITGFIL